MKRVTIRQFLKRKILYINIRVLIGITMEINQVLKIGGNVLTQAKKTYVKPIVEVFNPKTLGIELTSNIGKVEEANIAKQIKGYREFCEYAKLQKDTSFNIQELIAEGFTDFKDITDLKKIVDKTNELIKELNLRRSHQIELINVNEIMSLLKTTQKKEIPLGDITQIFQQYVERFSLSMDKFMHDILSQINKKNSKQVAKILNHMSKTRDEYSCWDLNENIKYFLDNDIWANKYQTMAYDILSQCGNKTIKHTWFDNEVLERFPEICKIEILKHVKSKLDFELVKIMAKRKSIRGDELYDTHAITTVLKQTKQAKEKILQNIEKQTQKGYSVEKQQRYKTLLENRVYQGEPCIAGPFPRQIPAFSEDISHLELMKKLVPGEVASLGNKMVAFNGEKIVELKLSKEQFKILFDDEHFYQGELGDCGGIATLDALSKSPKGKCHLLELFSEENGNIKIRLEGVNKDIIFENGSLPETVGCSGAKGIRMLEQAMAATKEGHLSSFREIRINGNVGKPLCISPFDNYFYPTEASMQNLEGISPIDTLRLLFDSSKYSQKKVSYFEIMDKLKELKNPNNIMLYGSRHEKPYVDWHIREQHYHNMSEYKDRFGQIMVTDPHSTFSSDPAPVPEVFNHKINSTTDFFEIL